MAGAKFLAPPYRPTTTSAQCLRLLGSERFFSLHCALSLAAQCIVIGPVCGFVAVFVCLFVGLFVALWICNRDNSKLRLIERFFH